MRKGAKYTGKYYKINEEILSDFKINPVINKIRNYINKWIQHVQRTDRDRLPHLVMKYRLCGKRSLGRHIKRLLNC